MSIKPRILFILTSHNKLGETGKQTGWYLPEFAHPYRILSPHYDCIFASPLGGEAPLDEGSLEAFKEDPESAAFLADPVAVKAYKETVKLTELTGDFAAVIYPGGHGPMWDLAHDAKSHQICAQVYEKGGIVAAVCHGPAAIVNVKLSNGDYLVAGKKVTGFSNAEEDAVQLSQVVPFMLEDQMVKNGGVFEKAAQMWQEHVVADQRVVTGQNPASSGAMANKIHELLQQ